MENEIQERDQLEENKEDNFKMLLKENEKLRQKANEHQKQIKKLKEGISPKLYQQNENLNTMEYVKTSVDEIVSNLSKQNDPKTLQNVARMLLR